jgi:hypothetical protein
MTANSRWLDEPLISEQIRGYRIFCSMRDIAQAKPYTVKEDANKWGVQILTVLSHKMLLTVVETQQASRDLDELLE